MQESIVMAKESVINDKKTIINVRVVYYNGHHNVKFADKNYHIEDFKIAYEQLETWCYTFLCSGWSIFIDERSPLKVSSLLLDKKGGINIVLKGKNDNVITSKSVFISMWLFDVVEPKK